MQSRLSVESVSKLGEVERAELMRYLWARYAGVFDERQMVRHIQDYVGLEIADQQVSEIIRTCAEGKRILDVGSGFGSFVLAARLRGLDAVGIDIDQFVVEFARRRLREQRPGDDPTRVYYLGDTLKLPFESGSIDVLTLWNVLEHVPDYQRVLSEAVRVLRPGGCVYLVCPNYAAFRQEAHYHVFWPPLLPRRLARVYLRLRGKDPTFFETEVFYRTNWAVIHALKRCGVEVCDPRSDKLMDPALIRSQRTRRLLAVLQRCRLVWLVRLFLLLTFYNPFKHSVILYAVK